MYAAEAREKAFDELMLELSKDKGFYKELIVVTVNYYSMSMGIASRGQVNHTFRLLKSRIVSLKRSSPRAFVHSETGSGIIGKSLTRTLTLVQQAKSGQDRALAVEEVIHLVHSTGTLLAYLFDGVKGTKVEGLVANMLDRLAV